MKKISLIFIICLFINGVIGDTDEVSVSNGDSVTLHTKVTDIQTDHLIVWRFNGSRIAKINREVSVNPVYEDVDERFKDRLKMNPQTGDLTITHITSQHTGEYKLEITRENRKTKRFSVTVSLKGKTQIVGDSVSLHIDVGEKQRKEKIHWKIKHKNSLVAEIMTENERVTKHETSNGFRGELKMNDHTGDLIITNMKKNDSGHYEADVTVNNSYTIHKTFSFTGSEASEIFDINDDEDVKSSSSRSSGVTAGICVGVLTLIVAVVGGVIYRCLIKNPEGTPPTTRYSTEMSEIHHRQVLESLTQNKETDINPHGEETVPLRNAESRET